MLFIILVVLSGMPNNTKKNRRKKKRTEEKEKNKEDEEKINENDRKEKEKEKILYENFINAQYEYFKYIEPIRIKEIHERNKGKVINPYHWRSQLMEKVNKDKEEVSCKKDTSNYKKILLTIHPDKNLDRVEEATKGFQFVQTLIDDDKIDDLANIMNAQDVWVTLKEMTEENSMYMKKKYCDKIRDTAWFTWTIKDDEIYVTEEELKELIIAENIKLEKENERLRLYNKEMEEHKEFMRKIREANDEYDRRKKGENGNVKESDGEPEK